jgi:hypothetical protein
MAKPDLSKLAVARKGQGAPAEPPIDLLADEAAGLPHVLAAIARRSTTRAGTPTIAVTVRLDQPRYEAMKALVSRLKATNQDVLVAGLDFFLEEARKHGLT